MGQKPTRLFFIDAMRAWAILMMLQGHFIDGLLDPVFRDNGNIIFNIWRYFRGITAPVFFTVSGFIFTYLLIKAPQKGWENPRVKKGIRRGLQLLLVGYLLRMNIFGLFSGHVYDAFYVVDVLHCIGVSILTLIGMYLFAAQKKKYLFPALLLGTTLVLFLFEPIYKDWSFAFLPDFLANYFTKANGSVFTIIPWLGYTTVGGFLALLFNRYKDFRHLYATVIPVAALVGLSLIFFSSKVFLGIYDWSGIALFKMIENNNYLFIRLGDVFVIFAIFMLFRRFMTNTTVLKIGASTLSIYVIHFIVLYGSFTGLGLYSFLHHSLSPYIVIPGALLFMIGCTFLALQYGKHEAEMKTQISQVISFLKQQTLELKNTTEPILREVYIRFRVVLRKFLRTVRS